MSRDPFITDAMIAEPLQRGTIPPKTDECRACGVSITLADDGAWQDDSGACGCGVQEHEPGGFSQYAADQLARDTPWYDDPKEG